MFDILSDDSFQKLVTNILSFFEVYIIAMTAWIAFGAWQTSSEANKLQLLPILSIYFRENQNDFKVRIRNIGHGPAFNIKIDPTHTILTDIKQLWKLTLKVPGTNVLAIDEERDLLAESFINGNKVDNLNEIMVFNLSPGGNQHLDNAEFYIFFQNGSGEKYFTKVETGFNGTSIIVQPKQFSLFESLKYSAQTIASSIKLKITLFRYQPGKSAS